MGRLSSLEANAPPRRVTTSNPPFFVNAPDTARILTSETFGPVVVVQQFETEEEVVDRCNDTTYGLHASLFTRDISRAHRVIKALDTGMVAVNCGSRVVAYDLPFGDWKQSGSGRELGRLGLKRYYEIKSVVIKL